MKNSILLLILFTGILFSSCTVTKQLEIKQLTITEISNFYSSKKIPISKVLLIKSPESYQVLSDLNLAELPSVIIFDNDGRQINYDQVDYCVADPIKFIKEFSFEHELKYTGYTQEEYMNHLKLLDEKREFKSSNKSKIVFINTAVYSDKIGMNKKPFKMLQLENEIFKIFYVNIDPRSDWNIEKIESAN